jgi:hypothetical protein
MELTALMQKQAVILYWKTFSQSAQEEERQQNVSGLLLIVGLLISRLGKNIA